jgi:hypothetical protein
MELGNSISNGAESWVKASSLLDRLPLLLHDKGVFSEQDSL